ncbi:NAD(P)/FAD-dependent oxidoreductase [Arthrobacter pigmenti]
MASNPQLQDRPRVLIVGGGYVGFYAAMRLQQKIKESGGVVTVVDPLPYMTYQPFLPEVAGGNIEARHAVVSHRRHLKDTELIDGEVVQIDHKARKAIVRLQDEETMEIPYQDIIMSAGAVTKTFPIPGLADNGIGFKTIEEAVALRNRVLEKIENGSVERDDEVRRRALTFVLVGGGFAGIEAIAELEDLARAAVRRNARLTMKDVRFVLVEAMGRVMPEVTEAQAEGVVQHLRDRGIEVMLNTSLESVEDGTLKLINMPDKTPAEEIAADTLIWTAGVRANPLAAESGFPVDDRGRIKAGADLRITGDDGPLDNAWTAGDVAAVPDLSGGGVGGYCVPNAQHAVRQAKRLTSNLLAAREGQELVDYKHTNLGAVAGFGLGKGVANVYGFGFSGFPAWFMHRAYHGTAIPTVERKLRVFSGWFWNLVLSRDTTQLEDLDRPRAAFYAAAAPPRKKDDAGKDGSKKPGEKSQVGSGAASGSSK